MTQRNYLEADYASKATDYFGGSRHDWINRLPVDPSARILELGCGDGSTGRTALDEGKCGTYVGIEMFEPVALLATKHLTSVHIGDVDQLTLPYEEEYFDVLILSEVVEHLVDPEKTLARLLSLVRNGGWVMASSPNVSHWRVIKGLLFGKFEYTNSGVMDKTHLRWFTPKSYKSLYEKIGIEVEQVGPLGPLKGLTRIFDKVSFSLLSHLYITQINVIGKKSKNDR